MKAELEKVEEVRYAKCSYDGYGWFPSLQQHITNFSDIYAKID